MIAVKGYVKIIKAYNEKRFIKKIEQELVNLKKISYLTGQETPVLERLVSIQILGSKLPLKMNASLILPKDEDKACFNHS